MGYCLCFVVGTLTYLYAAKVEGVSIPILTAITSCYPVITMIIAWIVYANYHDTYLKFAISGMILIVIDIFLSKICYSSRQFSLIGDILVTAQEQVNLNKSFFIQILTAELEETSFPNAFKTHCCSSSESSAWTNA
jgi:hypothetical protein